MHKFSKEFLFSIRNHIPLTEVIQKFLRLPCKSSEGQFRFLCPNCLELRAIVNPRTNLARCFLCQRNYNSIDLVIIVKQVKFTQAIEYLSPLLAAHQQSHCVV